MTRPFDRSAALLPVLTAEEMRAWERRCFAPGALSERVVMESAGRAAAGAIAERFPGGRVVGVVGKGNNGGDAVVALRTLRAMGREVEAVVLGDAEIEPDLAHGWEIPVSDSPESAYRSAAVLVDGILGTGASGAPRGAAATAVREMNASGRPIVALDGPTGVDLTTGQVADSAIEAELTVTFGALKRGLLLYPGRAHAGRILLVEVGFPPLDDTVGSAAVVTRGWADRQLPAIAPDAHKSAVGLVGIVAGRTGFGGAAIMAAMGALRGGSGGVRIVSTNSNRSPVHAAVPEAVFIDREDPGVIEALAGTRSIVVGPGIGTDDSAASMLQSILDTYRGRVVLDADAVTILGREPDLLSPERAASCVLTPHPGELARLLDTEIDRVLGDRAAAAREAADRFGCTVLAKGAPSLIAAEGLPILINVTGHSGVATGGMGDTLAGIIAAFLAAGAAPPEGAALGLHFAGRAAEAAGRGRGLLPRDVAEALPSVLAETPASASTTAPCLYELAPPG